MRSKSCNINNILNIDDLEFSIFTDQINIHDLTICLLNKDSTDTVVDDKGNIIEDLFVVLTKITVDNIDFTDKINFISTYTNNENEPVNTNGWMNYSKNFEIILQTPGWFFRRNIDSLDDSEIFKWLKLQESYSNAL